MYHVSVDSYRKTTIDSMITSPRHVLSISHQLPQSFEQGGAQQMGHPQAQKVLKSIFEKNQLGCFFDLNFLGAENNLFTKQNTSLSRCWLSKEKQLPLQVRTFRFANRRRLVGQVVHCGFSQDFDSHSLGRFLALCSKNWSFLLMQPTRWKRF